MKNKGTLIFFCGKMGSGKSTLSIITWTTNYPIEGNIMLNKLAFIYIFAALLFPLNARCEPSFMDKISGLWEKPFIISGVRRNLI
jgi:ABC-type oligopeptide transport system ATPase subunit